MYRRLLCVCFLLTIYFAAIQSAKYESPLKTFQRRISPEQNSTGNSIPNGVYSDSTYVPKVTIENLGTARGTVMVSALTQRDFYAFFSIPYAKPPTGKRRFKSTVEWSGRWTTIGEYDASYLRARCPQMSMIIDELVVGDEDCLHLSIYSPQKPDVDEKLPVMVFIHGGAYTTGEASLYVPTKLMDREVMVVVVQYRLSTLGFLYSGTNDAPGNMGLLDQITALRWVQDYISYFGGDKDRVTIFGQSAGGASVSLLQMSPLTNATANTERGQLMHGVIPMSGSALEYWTMDKDPQNSLIVHASKFEPTCYKEGDDNEKIMDCIRARSVQEIIIAATAVYTEDRRNGELGFRGMCPVVQDSVNITGELVLPKSPNEILDEGSFLRVNVMPGSVRDEGSLVVGLTYDGFLAPGGYANNTQFLRDELLATLMRAFGIEDNTGSVENGMKLAFLDGVEMGNLNDMIPGMVDMTGMFFLKSGAWTMAHKMALAAPEIDIYFYSFEFESDDSLFDWMFISDPNIPVEGGVGHADDLLYLFYLPSFQDDSEKWMSNIHSIMWSNFAIEGNPTPNSSELPSKWIKYTPENEHFMLIHRDYIGPDQDFSSRWTYHSKTKKEQLPGSTPEGNNLQEKIDVYQKQIENNDQTIKSYQIGVGVLAGLLGCVLIIATAFIAKRYSKNRSRIA